VVDKIQTSLWLRKELKHIVDNESLNLSQFVNDSLEKYFSVSSVEDIDNKLVKLRENVATLEKRRGDLIGQGVAETRDGAVANVVLEEMKRYYIARRNQDASGVVDEAWISSPKNLQRCKQIGREPLEILKEIREWYDDIQENNG